VTKSHDVKQTKSVTLEGWLSFAPILFIPQQGEQNATRSPFARIKFISHGKPMNKGLA